MNLAFLLTPKADVAYIYDDFTLRQVLEKMEHHGYTAIPIINREGEYVGTLTEGDLLWYIKNEHLLNLYDAEQEPVATATAVNCNYLRLREAPSASARELAKMYPGEKISVLEIGDTWSKVFYNGISGYAMTEFLQFPDA